ncbi:MAG: NAD(P)H-hydrate dehydratase [Bacteroidetes bacterium]|nr:NAD(P)H-hydrate dehydratase [Bacteroidota bacterium]
MKILSAAEIRKADAYTILHKPLSSIDLMERASIAFVDAFCGEFSGEKSVLVFCGHGNNGGDGLAISRLLIEEHFEVQTLILKTEGETSEDFKINVERLSKTKGSIVQIISEVPEILENTIIVDALFGTGLSRNIEGFAAEIINAINASNNKIVSVDMPSGLYANVANDADDVIIKADFTYTFQLPKLSFFNSKNFDYTGEWEVLDIGLHEKFIEETPTKNFYISEDIAAGILKTRKRNSHKGTYGHALIWAGAQGKIGAAVLCAKACVHTGAGLTTAYIPGCGYEIMQTALPEAMVILDAHKKHLTGKPDTRIFQAIGAGCGVGKEAGTKEGLTQLLRYAGNTPIVLDADALNIISENKELLDLLPQNTIITPHPKEFDRLSGDSANELERQTKAKEFAATHNIVVVLKGTYTAINLPNGETYFNATGNAGMAKGGSGDVLTGIITALLAQHYSLKDAAILGVYLHGLAGDIATEKHGIWSSTATNIIEELGEAFMCLSF